MASQNSDVDSELDSNSDVNKDASDPYETQDTKTIGDLGFYHIKFYYGDVWVYVAAFSSDLGISSMGYTGNVTVNAC